MQSTASFVSLAHAAASPRSALLEYARAGVALLIVLSVVLPTILQPVKVAVLAATLACMLLSPATWTSPSTRGQLALDLSALAYSVAGLGWVVYGLQRGNPGAASMMTVHAAYPLLFVFLARLARADDFARVSRVLVVSAVLVIGSQLLFIASFFGFDGGALFDYYQRRDDVVTSIDAGEDYLLFTVPSVSSLLFLLPWLVAHVLLSERHRLRYAALLLLSTGLLVLAGRRALILGTFFGVLAMLASTPRDILRGSPLRAREVLVAFAFAASLVAWGFDAGWLNHEILLDRSTSVFDFSENESNLERRYQFRSLMEGIAERPAFGHGLGAAAAYLRSETQPWAYELSYAALAFHVGLIGLLLYAAGVLFILFALRRLSLKGAATHPQRLAAIAFLGGFVAFLVANATNPYLAKFDYMWTLFVPLAMIRAHLGSAGRARA